MTSVRSSIGRQIHGSVAAASLFARSECRAYRQTHSTSKEQTSLKRRSLLKGALSLAVIPFLQVPSPAFAEESLVTYEDPLTGFSLSYPSSWTTSEAQSTNKVSVADRTMVWYPKDVPPREVNITLLINNAAADYTKLGSFGSAEEFGANLVNSMDRRYLLRGYRRQQEQNKDVQTADLVSAKSQKGMYSIEYLLKKPNEEPKRLLSLVALRFDGTYNRLYTLTAQCVEAECTKYDADIQTVMNSFKPPGNNA